jgi:hypothetical protein
MHERSPKNSAMDVLLYEREMLRHCAETVNAKQERFSESQSDQDRAEYYLGIEGFLLHYRNLLGFFINKGARPTDLTLGKTESWANGMAVDQTVTKALTERSQKINERHGLGRGDCYQKISWFLQHCTTHRHQEARSWDIENMFADLKPLLDEFVEHFAANG